MTRIPSIPADTYTPEQQALFDSITGGARAKLRPKREFLNEAGGLGGPFGPWIHSPALGDPAQTLGAAVRFKNRLSPVLRELAICVVGAHTKAEYEWWAHAKIARDEGMDGAILDSLLAGETPQFESDQERAVYAVASELVRTSNVSEATFSMAQSHLEDATIVDLVITVGYYNMVAMSLNAFNIPLPSTATKAFS